MNEILIQALYSHLNNVYDLRQKKGIDFHVSVDTVLQSINIIDLHVSVDTVLKSINISCNNLLSYK